MARPGGILRQDSRNRRSPSDRLGTGDAKTDELINLFRRIGEEQQPEAAVLVQTLRQVSQWMTSEDLAKVANTYLRSRRSRILSYDNFFRALNDFRSKLGSGSPVGLGGWRTRTEPEELTAEDHDTFDALIELIGKIVENDESSRMHIADNPEWYHPVRLLSSLISCPIATTMKATILTTLAAFAKSSGCATLILNCISGVLSALTVTGPKIGLKLEMEEMEVRYREFPVTKAIFLLMYRIFENLASQTMAQSFLQQFQDFISYAYDAVFLKLDERSFSSPQEHLDVLLSCLVLFEQSLKLLNDINIVFVPALLSHPGYILRQRILEGGALFEKLINWLIACTEEHEKSDKAHSSAVRKKLEDVILHILSIFDAVINRHDEFFKLLQENDINATVTSLEVSVAGTVNVRTGRKDLIFAFIRLLKFKDTRLDIARNAMTVIDFVTRRVDDHRDWITLLYFDEKLYQAVIQNFAQCLELDPNNAMEENTNLESSESLKLVQQGLTMVLGNLKYCSFPSVAHAVLGFPIRNGTLIGNSLGNEALSSALSRILELVEPGKLLYDMLPTLTELALDILEVLSGSQKTGAGVLEFIRSVWTGELTVRKLIDQLPLVDPTEIETFQFLRHQKAILHVISKEIRTLFEECKTQSAVDLISCVGGFKRGPEVAPASTSMFQTPMPESALTGPSAPLLLRLLSVAELHIPAVGPIRNLQFEVLEHSSVEDALEVAKIDTDDGQILHDVSTTLMYLRELLHVYEETVMGRTDVVHDFRMICDYIERETTLVGLVRARRECVDAWNVLVGVIAESCPHDVFAYPIIPNFFLNLAVILTSKLMSGLPSGDLRQVSDAISSSVAAFVRFTGPPKTNLRILDSLSVKGFASECLKVDYKSVIVRTGGTQLTELTKNLTKLILKPATTILERRECYATLLMILKFADWQYKRFSDAALSFCQSVQSVAASLRCLLKTALEFHVDVLVKTAMADSAVSRGPEEGIITQVLIRVWSLFDQENGIASYLRCDLVPRLISGLAKDNQLLTECISVQTDTSGILVNFDTKIDILTTWIFLPRSLPDDLEQLSPIFRSAIKTVLQFDVLRALPLVMDARTSIAAIQRAMITGTGLTVYGYCMRIFRKIMDFLIAVLHQVRMRPAHRDTMFKAYKFIQNYGMVISDMLREPTNADDPAWEDICRSVELVSLINHHYFVRELCNQESLDLSPEMLAIEMKLGRLLRNLGNCIVRAPKGNYKDYYADLKRWSQSVQLVSNLVSYLRRMMFEVLGRNEVNLAVIWPVFSRSEIFGRKELARGTVGISYGDLIAHIETLCGIFLSRATTVGNIRSAIAQSNENITETDLQLVLDSEYLPSRREDKRNFYRLFLHEQEWDVCVDLRKLLNVVEALTMMLVVHLEYAFCQFANDSSGSGAPLPANMRRALLPALEQEHPTTHFDEYCHFKSNVRDFVTDKLTTALANVYEKVGPDANVFLGIYVDRLYLLLQEAQS